MNEAPFPYQGPQELLPVITAALERNALAIALFAATAAGAALAWRRRHGTATLP